MVLLGVMAGTFVPLLGHAARQQREADRRQSALYEAQNILEEFSARPWDELTPARAAAVVLPETFRAQLPAAELAVTVTESEAEPGARRITVELSWMTSAGLRTPVRLVAWRYAPSPSAENPAGGRSG
jgi:hypothetical protein